VAYSRDGVTNDAAVLCADQQHAMKSRTGDRVAGQRRIRAILHGKRMLAACALHRVIRDYSVVAIVIDEDPILLRSDDGVCCYRRVIRRVQQNTVGPSACILYGIAHDVG